MGLFALLAGEKVAWDFWIHSDCFSGAAVWALHNCLQDSDCHSPNLEISKSWSIEHSLMRWLKIMIRLNQENIWPDQFEQKHKEI